MTKTGFDFKRSSNNNFHNMPITVLEWALAYAARGWQVFPVHGIDDAGCCTCGIPECLDAGKHPTERRGLKEATTDPEKIRAWWEAHPRRNIAVRTGDVSGVTVLDVDTNDGKIGAQTWAMLVAEKGEPETLISRTGSGGMHAVFRYNSALPTSSNTLGEGVDCRNDGGYIVVAPSRHRSGGVYKWENWEDDVLANLPAHLTKKIDNRGRKRKDDPKNKKYPIDQVAAMLKVIPSDDREMWRNVGVILGREFDRSDAAFEAYSEWSNTWQGQKKRNHDQIMRDAFYVESMKEGGLTLGTIVHHALQNGWAPTDGKVPVDRFVFYSPQGNYIYRPTSEHWPAQSVDALCARVNVAGQLIKPSDWIRKHCYATSLTADPDLEERISGFDVKNGILVENEDGNVFNTYMPPRIVSGDAKLARPWVQHCMSIFNKPGDCNQFFNFMAHRVQKPGEKPRFALLIAGEMGTGKDTVITMCGPAIGEWNCAAIEPKAFELPYNEYAAKEFVNISEASAHNEMSKWAFNELLKVLIAGNPDHQSVNEKYGRKYSVRLHCGVVLTTNHMLTGIYIPPGDRRYDCIECATLQELGLEDPIVRGEYFADLWSWYNDGGAAHVAAFLRERDIAGFHAGTGQRITEAHRKVVQAGFSGDETIIDVLLELGERAGDSDMVPPPIFTNKDVMDAFKAVSPEGRPADISKQMNHGLLRQGYMKLCNQKSSDGRWFIKKSDGGSAWATVFYDTRRLTAVQALERVATLQLPAEQF